MAPGWASRGARRRRGLASAPPVAAAILGEQLADDAEAPRRGRYGWRVRRAGGSAGEEEVGHVTAGDQEDETRRRIRGEGRELAVNRWRWRPEFEPVLVLGFSAAGGGKSFGGEGGSGQWLAAGRDEPMPWRNNGDSSPIIAGRQPGSVAAGKKLRGMTPATDRKGHSGGWCGR